MVDVSIVTKLLKKLTGIDGQAAGQDHTLSQADALTKNKNIYQAPFHGIPNTSSATPGQNLSCKNDVQRAGNCLDLSPALSSCQHSIFQQSLLWVITCYFDILNSKLRGAIKKSQKCQLSKKFSFNFFLKGG